MSERMRMESVDMVQKNIEKIAALFPNCVTETSDGKGGAKKAVDFDKLKQMLDTKEVAWGGGRVL